MSEIQQKVGELQERIATIARRCGREPSSITLVAVTKSVEIRRIREAYEAGLREFGENYLQEAVPKIRDLQGTARWHFIGHLQKNKANRAVELFHLIQSVDSLDLARKISARAQSLGRLQEILIQVDLSGEETKFGLPEARLFPTLEEMVRLSALCIVGLMTMPPWSSNPEDSRPYFRRLCTLFQEIDKRSYPNWESKFLSMGMTDDFEVAIEEGANMVRIGRAIFGERGKKIVAYPP